MGADEIIDAIDTSHYSRSTEKANEAVERARARALDVLRGAMECVRFLGTLERAISRDDHVIDHWVGWEMHEHIRAALRRAGAEVDGE